ncbi:hypothetical protein FPV67DRAFT_439059 [Lyophyllum atratum]|nr:hypothetical protein FPV67DRAFT_439059 [Lyophyllum atratum]
MRHTRTRYHLCPLEYAIARYLAFAYKKIRLRRGYTCGGRSAGGGGYGVLIYVLTGRSRTPPSVTTYHTEPFSIYVMYFNQYSTPIPRLSSHIHVYGYSTPPKNMNELKPRRASRFLDHQAIGVLEGPERRIQRSSAMRIRAAEERSNKYYTW